MLSCTTTSHHRAIAAHAADAARALVRALGLSALKPPAGSATAPDRRLQVILDGLPHRSTEEARRSARVRRRTVTPCPALGLALVLAAAGPAVSATDLGAIGPTYTIAEPHLLEMIAQRLREKERSGELARIEAQARQHGAASVRQPTPVPGLRATVAARSFLVDPSFVLDRNVLGSRGELLFAAGTRMNPLDVVSLSRPLLFFDARDGRQLRQARELLARGESRIKPILTGGSYLDLMRSWRRPVYYDQHGLLTRRLGIAQVPALVSQEGLRLRVDELELPQ